jgi:glutathione S-transferase
MTKENGIILYDSPTSPCGRRVRMTLIEKGLGFEIRWLNIALMEQKQDWFLAINPNGTVPAAVIDGKPLFESHAITGYLEALWPEPPLMPEDAYARAEVAMWQAWELAWAKPFAEIIYESAMKSRLRGLGLPPEDLIEKVSQNTKSPVYHRKVLKVLTSEPDEDLVADRLEQIFERLAHLETALGDGREWLVGGRFSLADISVAPRIDMFPRIGVTDIATRFPAMGRYLERVRARPSWAASEFGFPPAAPTVTVPARCAA